MLQKSGVAAFLIWALQPAAAQKARFPAGFSRLRAEQYFCVIHAPTKMIEFYSRRARRELLRGE
jgi:hypothetical protein